MKIDYQNNDYDLIGAFYGQKELFPLLTKALAFDLFDAIETNLPLGEIKKRISADATEAQLFLDVLSQAGLVIMENGYLFNAPIASEYLVKTSPFYCGTLEPVNGVFLWERLLPLLGEVCGRCTVTGDFPLNFVPKCVGLNFTETTPCDLVLAGHLDEEILTWCAADGVIAVCGRYCGDYGLNGAVEIYQAYLRQKRVFSIDAMVVDAFCREHDLYRTPCLTLTDDFSVVFVAKNESALNQLALSKEDRLIGDLKQLSVRSVKKIDPAAVVTASWVKDHCRFGCSTYGEKCCPPHSPGYAETQTRLADYTKALLMEGQPPTRDFQRLMLNAEKAAFKAGYYKAFAYWAGPCSLCTECKPPAPPKKCTATRPSMESAGIDVFATVRYQGHELKTLQEKTEFVKYFGLLLLE